MGKRLRTPHFIAGLGDGDVHEHPHVNAQDLSARTKRTPLQHNIRLRNYNKALLPHHLTERPLLERDAFSNSGDGVPHPASRSGPWQYTAMGFLAVMGILVAILLHLITDSSPERKHYRRRRPPASRKKKIDEWSDDEQSDQAYGADNEDVKGGMYYPLSPRYDQPEHRHRAGTLTHRSYQHPEPVGTSSYKSPSSARHQQTLECSPVPSGTMPVRPNTSRESSTPVPPPHVGLGLEGFQPSPKPRPTEDDVTSKRPWASSLQAHPLSPASSFNSIEKGISDSSMEKGDEELGTPRRGPSPTVAPLPQTSSRLLTPGSDDVTPHRANIRPILKAPVDGTTGDRLLQSPPLMSPSPPRRAEPRDGPKDNLQVFPYIPVLEKPEGPGARPPPPPESMSLEELHLVKMESGAPWEVATESQYAAYPGRIRPPQKEPRIDKHPRRIQRRSTPPEPSDKADSNDPRKNIVHKRQNITNCTDAESSLLSSVDFSEVTLESVIGGGGFGEVWRGSWRSTPVAVKVLTGSAQREKVSKAILEEFAAEINMLKGMRHPNICLYMGACFDPPNRCIITELAANGSLWDALRLPLSPPFQATDGITHVGWPSVLYSRQPGGMPNSYVSRPPPVVPQGTWPWGLVKRVACGAARGMAYLHSGRPPVLHRDLKSANILLDESYTAKVCDFGLSRIKAQDRSMTGNCGTVQWMAPEVLANQPYAEPADVFSFGIIMWETLSGECPYDGMSAIQCALAVLNRDLRPSIPDWCPPSLSALIRSCLEKDPSKRPTFAQILLALDAMP